MTIPNSYDKISKIKKNGMETKLKQPIIRPYVKLKKLQGEQQLRGKVFI